MNHIQMLNAPPLPATSGLTRNHTVVPDVSSVPGPSFPHLTTKKRLVAPTWLIDTRGTWSWALTLALCIRSNCTIWAESSQNLARFVCFPWKPMVRKLQEELDANVFDPFSCKKHSKGFENFWVQLQKLPKKKQNSKFSAFTPNFVVPPSQKQQKKKRGFFVEKFPKSPPGGRQCAKGTHVSYPVGSPLHVPCWVVHQRLVAVEMGKLMEKMVVFWRVLDPKKGNWPLYHDISLAWVHLTFVWCMDITYMQSKNLWEHLQNPSNVTSISAKPQMF